MLLTQEAVYSMSRFSGRKGAMILKIDLHKAFDSVSWSFLREVLLHFNFPVKLVDLIMFSITSSKLTILWNGESLPSFAPGRGLRQGDPLSPYLFILVMEKLSHMIHSTVDSKLWKPLKLSRGGYALSHLFFADDLMLFAEASSVQMDIIQQLLQQFASQSGLQLNVGKSKLFISKNISDARARALSQQSGIPLTADLGMYLGVPIRHGRNSASSYQYIIDKIRSKLANWKLRSLSLAGRRILIQSVTSTIATHTMQSTMLPVSVTNQIDRINRDFLWGDMDPSHHRPHLLQWDVVCQAKDRGGLGLRKARQMNSALIAKLAWKMGTNPVSPWCQALTKKYLQNCSFWDAPRLPTSSKQWRDILDSRKILTKGLVWQPGNDSTLSFWNTPWAAPKPLAELSPGQHANSDFTSLQVKDVIQDGSWNLELLSLLLPSSLVDVIRATLPPQEGDVRDRCLWYLSKHGEFTVSSAYNALMEECSVSPKEPSRWNWLWLLPCAGKIKLFIWTVLHARLFTNSYRFYRHIADSDLCPRCGEEEETTLHLLRDCSSSKDVWRLLAQDEFFFHQTDVISWLKTHGATFSSIEEGERSLMFLHTLWCIWLARNDQVFNNKVLHPPVVASQAASQTKDTQLAFPDLLCGRTSQVPKWVRWLPPEEGWLKLNSDGSVNSENHAAAGGVVRDHLGRWITGFVANIGTTSVFNAELWGVYIGLKHCLQLGFRRIVLELDSSSLVQTLQRDRHDTVISHLLRDCLQLLGRFEEISISHTLREGNTTADYLANLGHNIVSGVTFYSHPPSGLGQILLSDSMGLLFPRL